MKIAVLVLVCLTFLNAKIAVMPERDVAVIVNGVKIKKAELDRGVKALFPARYYHGTISDEKMKEFEKQVLDKLIEGELFFQYAKSIGIKVSQSDVDERVKNLKKLLKSQEKFNEVLKRSGITEKTLRESIYKEEVLKKFKKEKIDTNLSEEDLKEYYDKNMYKFKEPEKITAKIIYIRNDPTDPDGRSKAKKRIEEAYKKVKDGEDFADVAAKYSTAMSRIKGGDLGYVHKGMLEPSVEKKAFSMDADTMSEIIEEDVGFFVVRVEEKTEPNQLSFDKVKEGLAKDLKKKREEKKKAKLLDKLMSTAVIIK